MADAQHQTSDSDHPGYWLQLVRHPGHYHTQEKICQVNRTLAEIIETKLQSVVCVINSSDGDIVHFNFSVDVNVPSM